MRKGLTAVGRLLVGFVFAVSATVTCQAVVDAVAIPALKLIHAVTGGVLSWERKHTERSAFSTETRVLRRLGSIFRECSVK